MKKISFWLLLAGDFAVITLLTLSIVYIPSSPPNTPLDLAVSIGPFLLAWPIANITIRAFDPQMPVKKFILRSAAAWLATGIAAEVGRAISLLVIKDQIIFILPIILDMIEGSLLFIGWRAAFKLILNVTTMPGRSKIKIAIWSTLISLASIAATCSLLFLYVIASYSQSIYLVQDVISQPAAIVFGAGVWPDGSPSQVMVERVKTASDLFLAGKVQKLILSGGKQETNAMFQLALKFGVQSDSLIIDNAGYETYASCYRAKNLFNISQAVVISQRFHLFRALFICNSLGIATIGVASDQGFYSPKLQVYSYLREIPATALAWWKIYVTKPTPTLVDG